MRKFIVSVVWVLVAFVLIFDVVLIVGKRLPVEHSFTRTIALQQPPQQVWNVISDFQHEPEWLTNLRSVQRQPDHNGFSVWRETDRHNDWQDYATAQFRPPIYLVRTIADDKSAVQGSWEFVLTPQGSSSTQIQITERGMIRNPFLRFIDAKYFKTKSLDQYLRMLAAKFHENPAIH